MIQTINGGFTMITVGAIPTPGMLFGTVGTTELLNQINMNLNSSFFGSIDDILSKGREMFINNRVIPIRQIGVTIKNAIGIGINNDIFIPITSEDRLKSIPTCMHLPILMHKPIRKLFNEGRIFGFGYEFIPEEDIYGRLINNGYVNDIAEAMDEDDHVTFTWEFSSDDPELTYEQQEIIEESRRYIDEILETTNYDPTDYDNLRG